MSFASRHAKAERRHVNPDNITAALYIQSVLAGGGPLVANGLEVERLEQYEENEFSLHSIKAKYDACRFESTKEGALKAHITLSGDFNYKYSKEYKEKMGYFHRLVPEWYDQQKDQLTAEGQHAIIDAFQGMFHDAPTGDFSKPHVIELTFSPSLVEKITAMARSKRVTKDRSMLALMNNPVKLGFNTFSDHVDKSRDRTAYPGGGFC